MPRRRHEWDSRAAGMDADRSADPAPLVTRRRRPVGADGTGAHRLPAFPITGLPDHRPSRSPASPAGERGGPMSHRHGHP
ncbi:hypothetical protein ACFQX6_43765 [Streptosporangium lutulentum]